MACSTFLFDYLTFLPGSHRFSTRGGSTCTTHPQQNGDGAMRGEVVTFLHTLPSLQRGDLHALSKSAVFFRPPGFRGGFRFNIQIKGRF
ncbi:hypothetical protein CEXT_490111 [Caerostris extrusa]|uniref:Uncharacterized protein n=1 Tax=Caerostris extrusa TaxID=172846 RepID=A0AAV4WW36_CAEEX|nr:hypothetical protein CEXT_490111 [Caerostris extrusa]